MRAALRAAVDALAAASPGDLSDAGLAALVTGLDRDFNRLDAARTELAGVFDARGVWLADAARSGAGWVAARTEQSRPEAAARFRLARALRTMPGVAAAYTDGRLGAAKARLLADAAADAPEVFAEHETALIEHAEKLRVDQCSRLLAFWRAHANPDGATGREAKQYAKRALHLSQSFDGSWHLNGSLTPEHGEILATALDRRCQALYQADKAVADATGTPIARTAAQRRVDALVELVTQATASGEHGCGVNTPSITALVHLEHLADVRTRPGDVVGETEHGHPVSAATAQRWTCDAAVSRVVFGPGSVPIDLGTSARFPSPAQRRALAARDRGCVFPGCDRRPGWTNAHHLTHWVHGGPTDLDNLVLLCVYHHHQVHEGGYRISRSPDGQLSFAHPDGTPLTVSKHRYTHNPAPPAGPPPSTGIGRGPRGRSDPSRPTQRGPSVANGHATPPVTQRATPRTTNSSGPSPAG